METHDSKIYLFAVAGQSRDNPDACYCDLACDPDANTPIWLILDSPDWMLCYYAVRLEGSKIYIYQAFGNFSRGWDIDGHETKDCDEAREIEEFIKNGGLG